MASRHSNPRDREFWLPEPIWPDGVKMPGRPPLLVFLDLKDWIGLAKVIRGTGSNAYADLLQAAEAASTEGRIQVVITSALHREIMKITDPKQRVVLSEVADHFANYRYLAGLPDIFSMELRAALDKFTGTSTGEGTWFPLLGASALHAHGMRGGLKVMHGNEDVTEGFRETNPDLMRKMERMAEQALLSGPSDADIPSLRASGYRPEIPEQFAPDNAAHEAAWTERARGLRATHVLRDLVVARHLIFELNDRMSSELAARGIRFEEVIADSSAGRHLVMSMPSSATMVSLLAQHHQDPNRPWTANDIYDIDSLSVAVPYADIVMADSAARDAVLRRGLDQAYGTVMPRRPTDLTSIIEGLGGGDSATPES